MSSSAEYSVVLALRAADYATAPIRAVKAQMAALKGSLAAFGRERLGTARLINGLKGVSAAAANARKHIDFMVKAALASLSIGAAASVAGLWHLMRSTAEVGSEMKLLADRFDMPVEKMKEWSYAGKQFGIDNDTMAASLGIMTRGIGQAVNGTGKAKDVFAALGIKLQDVQGHVRGTDSVMMDVANKLKLIPDAAERAAVMTALFGKQGAALGPMFAQGGAKLEEFFARSRRFGVMTDEGADRMVEFNRTVQDLDMASGGFGKTIASKLIPVVQPLIKDLTEWMIVNRQIIASQIGDVVKMIADGVKQIDLTGAVKGMLDFIKNTIAAVKAVGGFKVVFGIMAAAMVAGPLVSLGQLIGSVGKLGFAVVATGAKLAFYLGAQAVGAVMSFVQALRYGIGVQGALNVVMSANPIGLIVIGVAAVIAGVVALYNTWKPFQEAVDATLAKIKSMFAMIAGWVGKKLGIDVNVSSNDPKVSGDKTADGGSSGEASKTSDSSAPTKIPGLPEASQPAMPPVALPTYPAMAAPDPVQGEITVRIKSDSPAQVESSRVSGKSVKVTTDLQVGRGGVGK